jgi:predicted kinase
MPRAIVAVTGTINAGKSTLAEAIAKRLDAVLLSSDRIRSGMLSRYGRSGERVFHTMRAELDLARARGRWVVLDSTGMSPRFRGLLSEYRDEIIHVHLTLSRVEIFEERERERIDRVDAVPRSAYYDSVSVCFTTEPDLTLATDTIGPEGVFQATAPYIGPYIEEEAKR